MEIFERFHWCHIWDVKIRPLMDGNFLQLFYSLVLFVINVKIRPLMDGNNNDLSPRNIYNVKIRPLMDGNKFGINSMISSIFSMLKSDH